MAKVAILIDGGFFRKRYQLMYGPQTPEQRAKELMEYCYRHLDGKNDTPKDELYRIFYYDCPPIGKKLTHPLTGKQTDYSTTDMYKWGNAFIAQMMRQRKVALRLGRLADERAGYILPGNTVKSLIDGVLKLDDLEEKDFILDIKQKGVDMKIGVDIASLAYKKQVDRIILIAGDSDFVPASKLARREGIDFILDPMWNHVNSDLFEHIDGLTTKCRRPK
jgi:uncharacterized LabA/DUF88 family protein